MVEIKFLEKKECEWFDTGERELLHGINYAFKVLDNVSGEWLMNVQISDKNKAIVTIPTSEKTTSLHDQIKRKTAVFIPCKDRNEFYHLLGISYIDSGRLHYRRVDDASDVPEEIKQKFQLESHEVVGKGDKLKGKIVAIVSKEKPEDMAHLFFLERIRPVFVSIED